MQKRQTTDTLESSRDPENSREVISTIGWLSASILHDLRNPLGTICAGAELLMDLDRQFPGRGYSVEALDVSERARARSLLESHRVVLDALAALLIRDETAQGDQLDQILSATSRKVTPLPSRRGSKEA